MVSKSNCVSATTYSVLHRHTQQTLTSKRIFAIPTYYCIQHEHVISNQSHLLFTKKDQRVIGAHWGFGDSIIQSDRCGQ